ncbi:AMP-binding protein [Pseudoxanthomonas sp. SE1]|uniref:class I adenylate-forming enzyme family protein n=1 Tax=Pseudoxanthomonas sp. SE1 TaxID=1664560 RepID=UPI00240E7ADA|nr:AMP-binding protein [Pseudoxanthomonas sp. SE1]WFC40772.1 AMP-binding protein [Pseudoxanthomonas sp. SE1]
MERLATRLARIARTTPQRTAMMEGERTIDYGTFWSQASGFAHHLRQAGLRAGERVALVLPNRIEAAVALYGIWLAGGVAAPLNAQARSRDFMPWLRHCGARFVVHESGHRDMEQTFAQWEDATPAPQAIALAPDGGLPAVKGDEDWPQRDADDTLAQLLYTSGTTGEPKGVMLSHTNLAANTDAVIAYLDLTREDVIVSVLPFYYAYGASVLHTHLASGACLVLGPGMVFPIQVLDALQRHRATGFSGVPSTYVLLMEMLERRSHDLSSLRYLTQAGGAMAPAVADRVRAVLPDARLFLMYGQTEATSRISWLPPERLDDKRGSVGIPVQDTQWRILREDGSPAATGEAGEVCVRGPGIMQGYWNHPAGTASVLRDGWLHTGDLGHVDADGYLFLQGRRSDMIKTGAHRVHPNDVEEVIAELAGIREVAVVGVDDDTLGQVIKAFVVADECIPRAEDRIKAHCRARLPAYKIPRHITFVEALPRTASGKVRRIQLTEQTTTP